MALRHYDSDGNIDYDGIRAEANRLREEALDALWHATGRGLHGLAAKLASLWHGLGHPMTHGPAHAARRATV